MLWTIIVFLERPIVRHETECDNRLRLDILFPTLPEIEPLWHSVCCSGRTHRSASGRRNGC